MVQQQVVWRATLFLLLVLPLQSSGHFLSSLSEALQCKVCQESCAVCESNPEELPARLREVVYRLQGSEDDSPSYAGCTDPHLSSEERRLSQVAIAREETHSEDRSRGLKPWALPRGEFEKAQWTVASEDSPTTQYVDLLQNPETFTGYAGPNARRIWQAIYEENCFGGEMEGMCLEERVFFRLLSGLQSSINTHIAMTVEPGSAPNVDMYIARVGRFPERIKNLFFTYLFVLRAVGKAAPMLEAMDFGTGNETDDIRSKERAMALLDVDVPVMLAGFNESQMFKVRSEELMADCPATLDSMGDVRTLHTWYLQHAAKKAQLKEQFREKFRNISRIMDCVGCEKCRLWGKLQFLGLGTAMKVLFGADDLKTGVSGRVSSTADGGILLRADPNDPDSTEFALTHNEVVALLNVLHRLSLSVQAVQDMRLREQMRTIWWLGGLIVTTALVTAALMSGLFSCFCRKAEGIRKERPSKDVDHRDAETTTADSNMLRTIRRRKAD